MSIEFPDFYYPAFAPLSAPMANHLLLQEARQYLRRPAQRPGDSMLISLVLEKIVRSETIIYKYLSPFVRSDQKRQERGSRADFPNPGWLLETLAQYTPSHARYSEATLDYWQKRGLLRREKTRGGLDVTSVAALLIARLTERNLQKNWLPPCVPEGEPYWWCYGRSGPDAPIQSIPVPIPTGVSASMILWTQFKGAFWDREWCREQVVTQTPEKLLVWSGDRFYRFAGSPNIEELRIWDEEIPHKLHIAQNDSLFGRKPVQIILLEEARKMVLEKIITEGWCHD